MFFQAILPTFSTGAAGTMISSLSADPDNPIIAILSSKYRDGTPIFKLVVWEQVLMKIVNLIKFNRYVIHAEFTKKHQDVAMFLIIHNSLKLQQVMKDKKE